MCVCVYAHARKVNLRTGHEGSEGEQRCSSTLSWTSALDLGRVVNSTTNLLYARERPGTHCIGGWVGLRAGLVGCGKMSFPPPGFDPRTVQSVASCYTDNAVPSHMYASQFILRVFRSWYGLEVYCEARMTTSYLEPLANDETPRSRWAQNVPGCFQPTENLRTETCAKS